MCVSRGNSISWPDGKKHNVCLYFQSCPDSVILYQPFSACAVLPGTGKCPVKKDVLGLICRKTHHKWLTYVRVLWISWYLLVNPTCDSPQHVMLPSNLFLQLNKYKLLAWSNLFRWILIMNKTNKALYNKTNMMQWRGLWKIAHKKVNISQYCDRHLNSPYKMTTILDGRSDENNKHDQLDN